MCFTLPFLVIAWSNKHATILVISHECAAIVFLPLTMHQLMSQTTINFTILAILYLSQLSLH